MTRHELASFALKLLGIYALIEALPLFQSLGSLVYALRSNRPQGGMEVWAYAIMLIPLLLTAAAGAILLVFSRGLAPQLVGEDNPLGMSSVLTGRDVQAIGFAVVAVLIFLRALPQISYGIWTAFDARRSSGPGSGPTVQSFFRYGIPAIIQLVLAVVLFFQARGLASLWHRIRTGKYVRIEDAGQRRLRTDSHGQ